ncbi:MAG: VCBS repeat-containing protein [Lysobacteraceae bacterium]
MERHVFRLAVRRCLLCFAAGFAATAMAGTPGLPFSEDFSDATLKDSTLTNANWSTEEQALVLAWRREQYGGFYDGSTVVGSNISDDADYTRALALGDVDGDGDLDLVVGNAGSDTATPSTFQANHLYLNNGTNAPFASVVAITIAPPDLHHTLAVALGDVDGDGDLDMIAGNSDSRNRLYFNDGSGGFDAGHDITADSFGTFALALGDLDGDGDLDLVVGNFGQANRIYLNDGSGDPWGSLGSGSAIPGSNQYTYSLALGDVDGDSDLDLVAGNYNNQVNRLYRNDGSGGFASASNITPDAETTTSMVLGDIDGDGDLDLIVGNQNQANRIYLNDGVGDPWDSLASGTAIPNSNDNTLYLALADVDGDGDLDLIGGHSNSQQNRLFFNDGLGGFATSAPLSTDSQNTYALAIGDMDGDGDLDMVAGNFDEPNRLYLNTSNASPWNGVSGSDIPDSSQGTNALALGDVDGDGDLDLVNGNMSTNRLYRNDGNGDFSDNSLVTNDSQFTLALLMADVDGDGDFDLVAGNGPGEFSRVYLNNDGLGGSWTDSDLPGSDSLNTRTLALGDVDGDGDPDLVLGNYQQTNRLYRNDGNGGFIADGNITADAHATFALQMADVDGDGDLDLIAGNGGINFSRVYLNDDGLGGSWISSSLSGSDSLNTASLALGDVDGDGDPDLMLGVREQTNRLYRNNGSGGFSAAGSIGSPTDKTYVLSLIDVDGDGDLDLITGNVTQANRLYLNNGSNDPFANVNAINISTDTQYTYALMVGDVDGDGDPDLIAGNDNGQPDRLYLNRGIPDPWGGVSSSTLSGGTGGDVVVLGDVDRDGDIDLIAGNGNSTGKRLYLNNGSIDPWSGVSPVTVGGDTYKVTSLALGDVDGDGDLDLLAGHDETTAGRHNRYYLNNGGQGAGWLGFASGAEIGSEADQTYALALGDVDRDGDLDVIAGNLSASDRLYLSNGSATPWSAASTAIDLPGVARSTRALALGDVDHDGDLDLLAGNQGQLNRVYLNDRSVNVFGSASDIGSDTDTTTAVALGDVDHDGDLDVIAGNYGQPNRLYKNDGSGVFGDVSDLDTLAGDTWSLALGDIDADGFLDLLVGNNGPDRLQVNQGGIGAGWNGFDDDALSSVGGLTGSMAVADVDGDGAADVIASNRLYQRRLFHTALNQGASLRVDDGSAPDIVGVVLSADSMAPPTTGVDYWLSNNGGAQWFQAPLDRAFFFPTIGADLRWKAALHSSSPALTPLIDNIRIVDVLIFSDGFED